MPSNTPETRAPLEREDRYIVIKRKHHSAEQLDQLGDAMFLNGIGSIRAAVVEADWPEYEPVWQMIEDRVTGRHRQSSSNAGGVDVSALWKVHDALVAHHQWHAAQTEPDPEHGFIPADEYADSGLYEQTVAAIGALDPYLRSGPRDLEALASLSTPTAEPMAELQRLGQEYDGDDKTEGPFHVSRSSDGEKHWFSARDPAAGVTIPAKDRNDAYALVASLNRSCTVFARRALTTPPTPDRIGKDAVREALLDLPFANTAPIEWDHFEWLSAARALFATPAQEGEQ